MPATEVARWRAFYAIEPFGELREDYRNAMVCRALARLGGEKRDLQLRLFMIDWWKAPPTPEEIEARQIAELDGMFGAEGWREGGDA